MKQAKRFICILLALILYISAAMPVSASFPDVDKNAGYAEAVEYLADIGIFSGDENGNFNPDKTVTRAEMAVIICKMLRETEDLNKANTFTDVPQEHWANSYVARAAELGIISGYGDGTFGPGDAVTYEQAVTMIIRALGLEDEANEYGGYPHGYLASAQERSFLYGLSETIGTPMARKSIAVLIDNTQR